MKTLLILLVFSFYGHYVFAQSGLLSTKGISFPIYTTASRPSANSVEIGTVLYNTSDNTHQFSNGSTWLNLLGATALPAGPNIATLRNNGSGWVADYNITNDGLHTRIGTNTFGDDYTLIVGTGSGGLYTAVLAKGDYYGVIGESYNISGSGVYGNSDASEGIGVKGTSLYGYGLYGYSNTATGIYGISNYGTGILGESALGYAGKFKGSVYVGSGTIPASPIAPLYVAGSNVLTSASAYYTPYGYNGGNTWYFNSSSETWATGLLVDYDIVGKRAIVSAQNITTSDARIKNIIGLSNNQQDLAKVRQIQITDYSYKDVATWGNQTFKKVIAQQVEAIYPQAVRKMTSTIPDIYALAEKVTYDESNKTLTCTLSKEYDIKVGEKIEFVHEKQGKIQAEVVAVSGNSFTVKNWQYPTDKIFVYGREVNDFRTVDYEAISMLGISAIQELAKEVDELKKQNNKLKTDLSTRLEAIENLLANVKTEN